MDVPFHAMEARRTSVITNAFRVGRTLVVCCLSMAPPTAIGQTPLSIAQVAKKVSPSVVVIQGKTDSEDVLGSGFIVSKDGKIVTNLQLIRDIKTASVQLPNGETFDSISVLAT